MAVSGGAGRVIEQSPMVRVPGDKATWTELRRANYRISRGETFGMQSDGWGKEEDHTYRGDVWVWRPPPHMSRWAGKGRQIRQGTVAEKRGASNYPGD